VCTELAGEIGAETLLALEKKETGDHKTVQKNNTPSPRLANGTPTRVANSESNARRGSEHGSEAAVAIGKHVGEQERMDSRLIAAVPADGIVAMRDSVVLSAISRIVMRACTNIAVTCASLIASSMRRDILSELRAGLKQQNGIVSKPDPKPRTFAPSKGSSVAATMGDRIVSKAARRWARVEESGI